MNRIPAGKVEHAPGLVIRPGAPLLGELGPGAGRALPGDKSLSHRSALLAALACGESCIENFQVSGVTRPMLAALSALGFAWRLSGARLEVSSPGLAAIQADGFSEGVTLDCGNSATTLRLLAGALAALGRPAVLGGSPGLRRRPMGRIVEPLQEMGVRIQASAGCAPLTLQNSPLPLRPLQATLPVASAQVKTCLLLAALAAGGETCLVEPGPSRDHTERMLRSMGAWVESQTRPDGAVETRLAGSPGLRLAPLDMRLPGDFSAAAFLIVAALITPGSLLILRGVGLNPTRTGLLDALLAMGGDICVQNEIESGGEPQGDLVVRHSALQPVEIGGPQVVRMIDEFPAFAVAAAYAGGVSRVADALELRLKESDRISALCSELNAIGVNARETVDGFVIAGGRPPSGGRVDPHGDHRLAMSLAVAGLASSAPVQVNNAGIMAESFPCFAETLTGLGAQIEPA